MLCLFLFFVIAVLAFTGAPASFPVQLENRDLHRYLVWSKSIQDQAKNFIRTVLPKGSFVGIHLRNGVDWVSKALLVFSVVITEIIGEKKKNNEIS